MSSGKISALLAVVLLTCTAASGMVWDLGSVEAVDDVSLSLTSLRIDNDTVLMEWKTSNNWTGNGTADDPVVIDGLVISGTSFFLGNITKHVLVRNVSASSMQDTSAWSCGAGMQLWNCTNITICSVKAYGNEACGILMQGCSSILVRDSNVSAQPTGLIIDNSSYQVEVMNLTAYDDQVGIEVGGGNITIAWCDLIINARAGLILTNQSSGSAVYRNAFVMNDYASIAPVQAVDNGTGNVWNRSSGSFDGNYWSEQTGSAADWYYIVPYVVNGTANSSDARSLVYRPDAPDLPTALTALRGDNSATLTWTAPTTALRTGLEAYEIVRTEKGVIAEVPSGSTSFQSYHDTGLTNGLEYSYRIRSVDPKGCSAWTNLASITPMGVASAPVNLTAAPSDHTITLTWEEPLYAGGGTIDRYAIFLDGQVLGYSRTLSYNMTDLVNGQKYNITVRARNEVGWGNSTPMVQSIPVSVPDAPTNFVATPTYGKIILNWKAPLETGGLPLAGYRLERRTIGQDAVILFVNDTVYIDGNVTAGVEYAYLVSALNGLGEGAQARLNDVSTLLPTLLGYVTDQQGIGLANVTVSSGSASTTTGEDGSFALRLLPGEHNITFVLDGYQVRTVNVSLGVDPVSMGTISLQQLSEETGSSIDLFLIVGIAIVIIVMLLVFAVVMNRRKK